MTCRQWAAGEDSVPPPPHCRLPLSLWIDRSHGRAMRDLWCDASPTTGRDVVAFMFATWLIGVLAACAAVLGLLYAVAGRRTTIASGGGGGGARGGTTRCGLLGDHRAMLQLTSRLLLVALAYLAMLLFVLWLQMFDFGTAGGGAPMLGIVQHECVLAVCCAACNGLLCEAQSTDDVCTDDLSTCTTPLANHQSGALAILAVTLVVLGVVLLLNAALSALRWLAGRAPCAAPAARALEVGLPTPDPSGAPRSVGRRTQIDRRRAAAAAPEPDPCRTADRVALTLLRPLPPHPPRCARWSHLVVAPPSAPRARCSTRCCARRGRSRRSRRTRSSRRGACLARSPSSGCCRARSRSRTDSGTAGSSSSARPPRSTCHSR